MSLSTQLWHFLVHMRWHYQLFILSGGFLLGGFLSEPMEWGPFLFQFFNVHLLLFGGATAFNSYWDKDVGPIGGLRHPPVMRKWMWFASILVQMIGLLLAVPAGSAFVAIYTVSMLLFWVYSSPLTRWKGTPIKSLFAIGISTGANSLLMGYLAAGNAPFEGSVLYASIGVGLVILSLYPTSQIYQIEEDIKRGYQTFAVQFGIQGVQLFFKWSFAFGIILISLAMLRSYWWLSFLFLIVGIFVGIWVWQKLKKMTVDRDDYYRVMNIKFVTSLAFVCFLTIALLLKHTSVGIYLGANMLFK